MRQIIHIGYPKAGSSFIYDELLARSEASHIISDESLAFGWAPQSDCKPCWVKAPELARQYPEARIIIVTRHPGKWLESWWRHQTTTLNELGTNPLWKAMRTKFFAECVAPHLYSPYVVMEFRRHFEDVRVLPFALLAKDPEKFTAIFCEYCEIPVPDGIEYRSVNFSRSHTFSLIRCYMNRLWVRFGVRRWDNLYLDMMKHYVARADGVWRKIRGVIK